MSDISVTVSGDQIVVAVDPAPVAVSIAGQQGPPGPVAGADTQVLFNDGGDAAGGDSRFTWDKTTGKLRITGAAIEAGNDTTIGWPDVPLRRVGAGVLALRNGAVVQEQRWNETYTDDDNQAYARFYYNASGITPGWTFTTVAAGSGVLRDLVLSATATRIPGALHVGQGFGTGGLMYMRTGAVDAATGGSMSVIHRSASDSDYGSFASFTTGYTAATVFGEAVGGATQIAANRGKLLLRSTNADILFGTTSSTALMRVQHSTGHVQIYSTLHVGINDVGGSDSGVIIGKSDTPSAYNHLTIYSLYSTNPSHKLWQSSEGSLHDYRNVLWFRDATSPFERHARFYSKNFEFYESYTDGSNFGRAFIRFASNQLQIGSEAAGTGTVRPIYFVSNGSFNFRTSTDAIPKYVIGPARVDLYATNDGTNYERFATVWEASELRLKVEAGGTGTMRNASIWTNTNFYWRSSAGTAQLTLAGGSSANMSMTLRPTGTSLYSIIDMLGQDGSGPLGASLQAGQANLWIGADTHTFRKKDSSQNYLVLNTTVAAFTLPVRPKNDYTVATLPSAATVGNGAMAYVTDCTLTYTSANIGSAVAGTGGGANHTAVRVVNGAWVIG